MDRFNQDVFCKRLKERLEETNNTTRSLGALLGLTGATISRYATGTVSPKIGTIEAMANKLNVSPVWLMGGNVPKFVENLDKKENDIEKEFNKLMEKLAKSDEALLFSGQPLDEETKELLQISLRNSLELALQIKKQRKKNNK